MRHHSNGLYTSSHRESSAPTVARRALWRMVLTTQHPNITVNAFVGVRSPRGNLELSGK